MEIFAGFACKKAAYVKQQEEPRHELPVW